MATSRVACDSLNMALSASDDCCCYRQSADNKQRGSKSPWYHRVATMSQTESDGGNVLVIDALNCLGFFCPYVALKYRSPWMAVDIMGRQIRKFLDAAEDKELLCKFVVDCGWSSSEVQKGTRRVIVGVDTLLVELLRKQGAEVYTADRREGHDGDDIIALLAHHAGPRSLILSADRDMFRYQLPNIRERLMETFSVQKHTSGEENNATDQFCHSCAVVTVDVLCAFTLRYASYEPHVDVPMYVSPGGRNGQHVLSLVPVSKTERPEQLQRDIHHLQETIPWEPELWLTPGSRLESRLMETSQYIRGSSCSYVKMFGNLYGLIKPLRRAVYTVLQVPEQIREMYPEWDSEKQQVLWVDELLTPSTEDVPEELLKLLTDPDSPELTLRARSWLEERDPSYSHHSGAGQERNYARCFLLSDLIQAIPGSTRTVLEILEQISGMPKEV